MLIADQTSEDGVLGDAVETIVNDAVVGEPLTIHAEGLGVHIRVVGRMSRNQQYNMV